MNIGAVSTFVFNNQSSASLSSLQTQLADLQSQVGSGHKANDLAGYGASSQQILSTRGLISVMQANADTAAALDGHFNMADQSLTAAYNAGENLRTSILRAIGNNDGRYLTTALQSAFDAARTALNTSYQGEALFGGERTNSDPINVATLSALAAAPSTAAIFNESAGQKTIDLGDGPFAVGQTASQVSSGLFDAMRTLQQAIQAAGGALGNPLTATQTSALQAVAAQLSTADATITTAQGQNGDVQKRVAADATSLGHRVDVLTKALGDVAEADLAEVATRISAVQIQYQAVAQTFSHLSQLSLLNFLSTT